MSLPRVALILCSAALAAWPAGAQDYVRAECRPAIAGQRANPVSPLTARWYRRFWTGDCAGLSGCLSGSPNWNAVVGRLVQRSPSADRAAVLVKACRLGPLIGHEWTRERQVRRIDTADLRAFKSTLDGSGDVLRGLDRVEAQARAKIRPSSR